MELNEKLLEFKHRRCNLERENQKLEYNIKIELQRSKVH